MNLIIKIFPLWFRVVRFYVKARKIAADKNRTQIEKTNLIHELDKRYIHMDVPALGEETKGNTAAAVGFKDIAGIYCDLGCPADCLRYALSAGQYLAKCAKADAHTIEALYFCSLYSGCAYTQQKKLDSAIKQFDAMNILLNRAIERMPDNARLQQMQRYGYGQAYSAFVDLYNASESSKRPQIQTAVLTTLQRWEKQDPGNEKLINLIHKWTS